MSHQTNETRKSNFVADKMSHYEVLNVARDASQEEIRKSYQSLALRFHPDKLQSDSVDEESVDSSDWFIRIDEAWKVLRDEGSRRVYDAELLQRTCQEQYFVNEVLARDDLKYEQVEHYYYHDCRCGGMYVLPEELTRGESVYLSCDECSLLVQVNNA
ncbi:DPH4 homolog [Toxorhynchites rutilus septentrionalis]|uniref:DPH4 homolog n=1 Tax=Toxorhynchites rutilus septentrionalis TaxID=329112 RepID=UPI002478AA04|nr:DPH4 homolog [Toxorhynchites rutilus septentrionalis]